MWNYSEKLMDHFLNPRNAGEIEGANAVGEVGSIVCGDSMKLMLKVDPETERIVEAGFLTFGCGSAIASASALTEMVKGRTLEEASEVSDQTIADYLDGIPPEKMHCSVMGSDALRAAIADFRGEPAPADEEQGDVVCECFGVTRQKIEEVVREHGLTTVEQVTHYTKAGGGCGKCKPKIERILADVGKAGVGAPKRKRLTNIERIERIREAIEREIRPALQADGGDIELVDVDGLRVTVGLRGRCSGCLAAGATIDKVVETKLRDLVDPGIVVEQEE